MISSMLLNWKRPANSRQIISGWEQSSLITEVFVWNNDIATSVRTLNASALTVDASANAGVYPRFLLPCLATNECVLIQDDDLLIPEDTIARLYCHWKRDPYVIHGIFGRNRRSDGTYGAAVLGDREAPVILTRIAMLHRMYFSLFWSCVNDFRAIQRAAIPKGNGEDIIMSYVVRRHSGRLNKVHRLKVIELPAPYAICDLETHYLHRTRLMHFCEQWLNENTDDHSQHAVDASGVNAPPVPRPKTSTSRRIVRSARRIQLP